MNVSFDAIVQTQNSTGDDREHKREIKLGRVRDNDK